MPYDPPRQPVPPPDGVDPIEVELVYNVRPCGTCSFFWPADSTRQPYGPYTTFDFATNFPAEAAPPPGAAAFPWLSGVTRQPGFPDAEVMDGCRKAPIMTIGINPNLTAFAPGTMGASWCYPSFSSDGGAVSFAKYAFYYRYRSVFQERLDLAFARRFVTAADQVVAAKAGVLVEAKRASDAPAFDIRVQYDGEPAANITLPGAVGAPPYVVLIDIGARFTAGEVIAAPLAVPAGQTTQVYEQQIGYYERIVPILDRFTGFLQANGHARAALRVGEDVCQLDMVACASPHWAPEWLGGSPASESTIIRNCVAQNGWAIKQLVQTRPAVLLLVGEATFEMFRDAFARYITAPTPLPARPADGAYTLLRATTDPAAPVSFDVSTSVDGTPYSLSTRLIVAPHFSYADNFAPQHRLSPSDWATFERQFPDCAGFLTGDPRIARPAQANHYLAFEIADPAMTQITESWPAAAAALAPFYYDANAMIAAVFEQLYAAGSLAYVDGAGGAPGYLRRGEGACSFCVNAHWSFPAGCPYDKPPKAGDPALPDRFLQRIAAQLLNESASQATFASMRLLDNGYEARRDPPPPLR